MATLSEYLEETGETQTEFAVRLGLPPAAQSLISRYCTRTRRPPPEMIAKIEDATDGRVTLRSWLEDAA